MAETQTGALPPQTHTQPLKERREHGRALRAKFPRQRHATWKAPAHRRDPIEILIEQGKARLQDLLPLRYSRMKDSPFAFLRGAAAIMASDLATSPSSGLVVQSGGDCHCLNFGGFATPERRLVFDINDFDETAVAPWEWDLKRLATSFAVATLDKLDKENRFEIAALAAASYRKTMAKLAETPVLDAWYEALDVEDQRSAEAFGVSDRVLKKADAALKHAVEIHAVGHRPGPAPQIKDAPPLVYHPKTAQAAKFRSRVEGTLAHYRASLIPERRTLLDRYKLADAAYKVVGVGSVGTRCGIMLMVSGDGEVLYLQFKEAMASVLEAYTGASPYSHHGERVVRGQRLLQAASDILLGFGTGPTGRHIYVRQLRDAKIKPQLEFMGRKQFRRYAMTCGDVLARAHARTADAVVLSAYLGKGTSFDEAIAAFAASYAEQAEQDYQALQKAIKTGRLPVADRGS
jgi:uncharacterized protein (DUF2252 family)